MDTHDTEHELARVVRDDPHDRECVNVYVDALLEKGDPRGELASIDSAIPLGTVVGLKHMKRTLWPADNAILRTSPDISRLQTLMEEERRLIAAHGESITSDLIDYEQYFDDVRWRSGFLKHLELRNRRDAADAARALVSSESARFLRSLIVRNEDEFWVRSSSGDVRLIEALCEGDLSSLRTLRVEVDMNNVRTLCRAAPHLQSLQLLRPVHDLGALNLPELVTLTVSPYNPDTALGMSAPGLANLRSLHILNVGTNRLQPRQLLSLFDSARFPNLRGMTIDPVLAHGCAAALLDSTLLPQLSQLSVGLSTAWDARIFVERRSRLEHLESCRVVVEEQDQPVLAALSEFCEVDAGFGDWEDDLT